MPLYEYRCQRCDHGYECMSPASRMDEPPPCPDCGGPGKRQLSAFAFKDGRYGRFISGGKPATASPKAPDTSSQ